MAGPYWCWLCQQERSRCGGTNGSCPRVEAEAALYREEQEAGKYKTLFNTRRLREQNSSGISGRDLEKAAVESAKADGREIVSAKSYGEVKTPKRKGLEALA